MDRLGGVLDLVNNSPKGGWNAWKRRPPSSEIDDIGCNMPKGDPCQASRSRKQGLMVSSSCTKDSIPWLHQGWLLRSMSFVAANMALPLSSC